jgi:hypothetical protein
MFDDDVECEDVCMIDIEEWKWKKCCIVLYCVNGEEETLIGGREGCLK